MGIDRINQRYNDPSISSTSNVRRGDRPNETPKPNVQAPSDSVEISDEARELAKARQAVDAAPEVRADKVAAIKKSIADGTYSVSPELLARKLMESNNTDGLS